MTTLTELRKIHGDGKCHICGKPRAEQGSDFCSYPHGMLPVAPAIAEHPEGFWTWEIPSAHEEPDPSFPSQSGEAKT